MLAWPYLDHPDVLDYMVFQQSMPALVEDEHPINESSLMKLLPKIQYSGVIAMQWQKRKK